MRTMRWPEVALTTAAALAALTGCGVDGGPAGSPASSGAGALRTLAKVDGPREGLTPPPNTFAVLEVAYDAPATQRMWDENVPAGLPALEGDPLEPGRYGDLADVDLERQAVALWSSGQSGSCPGWVSGVELQDGVVVVTEDEAGGPGSVCTADYNSYRVLVVVDRADLPSPEAVATARARIRGVEMGSQVLVASYPLT